MNRPSPSFKASEYEEVFIGADDEFEPINSGSEQPIFYHRRMMEDYIRQEGVTLPDGVGPREGRTAYYKNLLNNHSDFADTYSDLVDRIDKILDGRVRTRLLHDDVQHGDAQHGDVQSGVAESEAARMVVGAREVGLVSFGLFGGLLAISAIFGETLIAPLVGWSGMVLGIGFYAMTKAPILLKSSSR